MKQAIDLWKDQQLSCVFSWLTEIKREQMKSGKMNERSEVITAQSTKL